MAQPNRQYFELRAGPRGLYAFIGDKFLGSVVVSGDQVVIYTSMSQAVHDVVIPALNLPEDESENISGSVS